MDDQKFKSAFQNLTGYPPLRWQVRLFRDYFAKNELPAVVNLPTGLGKTMVMAIWLIAREVNKQLPRRLIYVVDRRTVIDQATDWACKLRANSTANGEATIAISTLRGQLADNREWSRDMSRPAIIIGTVDLVGSGLLFSGYRSSFKRRPLEAGLLGQDSLLVLDEAHLSKPFEKLIKSISRFQNGHGSPMKVVRMSATSGDSDGELVFRLDTDPNSRTYDLQPDPDPDTGDERNHIITRFNAKKSLSTTTTDKVIDQLATVAGELESSHPASRIVIFVKTPKQVDDVRKALIKKDNTREPRIAQLTGTMRGLERDTLVTQPDDPTQHARAVMQRFVNPENDPSLGECFLISTSAGEVGFDLNADHMVCDEAPLDSMIQRLGRVNRRGLGEAEVHLIRQSDPKPKTDFDKACIAAADLFETELREDVSPQAIANLRVKLSPHTLQLDILAVDDAAYAAHREGRISAVIRAANTPVPTTVELTDILLDAWSMTSITEKMPGRPDVAPWLRGISEEVAQTTIVWRAELDLLADSPDAEMALKPIFAKHRVRPHESLTTNSKHVLQFLKDVVKDRPELNERPVAIKFTRDIFVKSLADLIDNPGPLFASDPTLILPVNVGGLNEAGMLDSSAVSKTPSDNDPIPKRLDVADQPGYEQREDATPRLRLIVHRTDEGNWVPESIHADVAIPEWLGPSYSTSTKLFDALRKQRFRIRHVQPIELDNEGSPKRSLVLLSPVANKN
ncbi:MAG: type I-U CRISPR-associated helicase/endonuclease Cas3, partial [Planctomycetales bacterium]|nr:type I-U CRISPR-associated helicase/endonuclease Cas3 [Planctomycetales bacterium]